MPGKSFLFLFAICLFSFVVSLAQNPYSHILIEGGGILQLSVNSLKKYNEGTSQENWTRMAITFTDTLDPGATWKLEFRANSTELNGDYGHELPLDQIEIEVFDAGGATNLGPWIQPAKQLESTFVTLVEGAPPGNFSDNKLYISYRIGNDTPLLGESPDYYYVDIEFKLSKF